MAPGSLLLASKSVLLLEGPDITVKNLRVDGALVVRAVTGAKVVLDGLTVSNKGWTWTPLDKVGNRSDESSSPVTALYGWLWTHPSYDVWRLGLCELLSSTVCVNVCCTPWRACAQAVAEDVAACGGAITRVAPQHNLSLHAPVLFLFCLFPFYAQWLMMCHAATWSLLLQVSDPTPEEAIRGFRVIHSETTELVFDKPGEYMVPEPVPAASASANAGAVAAVQGEVAAAVEQD